MSHIDGNAVQRMNHFTAVAAERLAKFAADQNIASCHVSFIATLGLTFLQLQVNARRHSQSQFIRRIFNKHANFIDEAGPQFLGLHRFWREFSDRRNESDPTFETATGKAIDDNSRRHAGLNFSQDPAQR